MISSGAEHGVDQPVLHLVEQRDPGKLEEEHLVLQLAVLLVALLNERSVERCLIPACLTTVECGK